MTNLMKSVAAAALIAASTTVATAAGFGIQTTVEDDSSITLDRVRADADGVVVIYDYSGGDFGAVLGSADLNSGANVDVRVQLDPNIAQTLAAVIYEGPMTEPSMAVDWIELDISDES